MTVIPQFYDFDVDMNERFIPLRSFRQRYRQSSSLTAWNFTGRYMTAMSAI